jgi:dTDP-4-dehydrorhamnose 3,5-epimerase
MPFKFKQFKLGGLRLIMSEVLSDQRGYFMESYRESDFAALGRNVNFKQDNISFSKKNVLRGLHYQLPPFAQGKLVRVLKGAVWDVAVDVRKSSPTFGKWEGVELNEENNLAFYLPEGFAHGFVVLSEEAMVLYKVTEEYHPECEKGIRWNDVGLDIKWPVENPLVSQRDSGLPLFKDAETYK